jgi:catechol 2,3-dioxygenase-like lactoylglutathione lyase family enzyme
LTCSAALGLLVAASSLAQDLDAQRPSPVRGLYHWIHTTGDAEAAFAFYANVFGIELARSPFAGPVPPDTPVPPIRPVAEARSDELVWDLTNTHGARFRTAFMHAPNTAFGLELSEFFDIERSERPANAWDPGASMLVFAVRDLAAVVDRVRESGAPIVTLGGEPLETGQGLELLVRDPDGYLVLTRQATADEIARAESDGEIVATSIGLTVADLDAALAFYRDLLGFEVLETRRASPATLRVLGLAGGALMQTVTHIPGTEISVSIAAFGNLPAQADPPQPFRWRLQDVGAPQFQLEVTGLDALLRRTRDAGYEFLSVDGRPIERPFGRFVFAIDGDGILVEYVEPTQQVRQ